MQHLKGKFGAKLDKLSLSRRCHSPICCSSEENVRSDGGSLRSCGEKPMAAASRFLSEVQKINECST